MFLDVKIVVKQKRIGVSRYSSFRGLPRPVTTLVQAGVVCVPVDGK